MAFLRKRKNAECINRGLRFPRALPWAMGNIWAYSPPQSFNQCNIVLPGRCPGLGAAIGLTARHNRAANAVKSFAYMNDFVKPKDQREFSRVGLARNRTFKKP